MDGISSLTRALEAESIGGNAMIPFSMCLLASVSEFLNISVPHFPDL